MSQANGFARLCDELPSHLERQIHAIKAEMKAEPVHPVYLDLELAANQKKVYQPLLDLDDETEAVVESKGLVRVLGAHYFTYDRNRLTRVISRDGWQPKCVREVARSFNENGDDVTLLPRSQQASLFFDQLVMFAYRQVFKERKTLNAWLLRTTEKQTHHDDSKVGIHILEASSSSPSASPSSRWIVSIPEELADILVPVEFLQAMARIVLEVWQHHQTPIGATGRFRVSSELFRRVQVVRPQKRLPRLEVIAKLDQALEDAYRAAAERICITLGLPITSRSASLKLEIEESVFVMLQSAIFYMRFYEASAFYSLTTLEARVPYGLTILTRRHLDLGEIHALERATNSLANIQISSVRPQLEGLTTRPEHLPLDGLDLRFLQTEAGRSMWHEMVDGQHLPAFALATFLKTIEEATEIQIEHRFPKAAFVLSQASYLESVGFVDINVPEPTELRPTYDQLVKFSADGSAHRSADYELQRWEKGQGILPYDVVARVEINNDDWLTQQVAKGDWKIKDYLSERWGYPEPSDGFHLMDLDARFVYPECGIRCVKRLEIKATGWFQEGSPPGGGLGYKAYFSLSNEISRFVAGITDGHGNAALITKGRVCAIYRRKEWEFYDRKRAEGTFRRCLSGHYRGLAGPLLNAAELLSHTHHKGAIFVLSDRRKKEWQQDEHRKTSFRHKYFLSMIRQGQIPLKTIREVDHLLSIAQVDGACIISRRGEILAYGQKIAVVPHAFRRREVGKFLLKAIGQPGTRRWSSALLSGATGWPVLNVSSDGPVTLFVGGEPIQLYPTPPGRTEASAKEDIAGNRSARRPGGGAGGDRAIIA